MAGRVAIVPGGSSGIGRAGALGLAGAADLKADAAAAVAQDARADAGFVATGIPFDSGAA
jgi:NAD(P)-dependent dehydrogenase (short-subunit alcohol dehydrogenase family)